MGNWERAMKFLSAGTFQPGTLEYKWWEYYDRIALVSTATRYQFFAVPAGAGGKTETDTNWQVANQMPESERMAVFYFCFYYLPHAAPMTAAVFQNIVDCLKNAWFQFKIFNKAPQAQFPLCVAFGNTLPAVVTGGAAGDNLTARAMFNGVYHLEIEIPLAAKTTINAEINFSTAPAAALDTDEIYFSMVGPKWSSGN
jgi:hypothetical protein